MINPDAETATIAPPWQHFKGIASKFHTTPLMWLRLLTSWLAIRGMYLLGCLAGVPYVHVVSTNPLIVLFASIEDLGVQTKMVNTPGPQLPLTVTRKQKWEVTK